MFGTPLCTPMTLPALELSLACSTGAKIKITGGKHQTNGRAFCLGNCPLTSQVLHLNLYRTESILHHAQILKGTVNSETCRKVSNHVFQFSFLHNIFHTFLCCPLHVPVSSTSLESFSLD